MLKSCLSHKVVRCAAGWAWYRRAAKRLRDGMVSWLRFYRAGTRPPPDGRAGQGPLSPPLPPLPGPPRTAPDPDRTRTGPDPGLRNGHVLIDHQGRRRYEVEQGRSHEAEMVPIHEYSRLVRS